MKWSPEAEAALKKVPFFVRKKVRARVENEARMDNCRIITLAEVRATQKRYLTHMDKEVKGYQVDGCLGANGCPHRAMTNDEILNRIEDVLKNANLRSFLQERVKGPLKFHHEFRVSIADCPNACSQPQIKDFCLIGACLPAQSGRPCSQCHACIEICRENAISFTDRAEPTPGIDSQKCVKCGQCIPVCPSGTLIEGKKGYRVQVGGKLGRHPQLAHELSGIYSADEALTLLQACIDLYKSKSHCGRRFGEILSPSDLEYLSNVISNTKNVV